MATTKTKVAEPEAVAAETAAAPLDPPLEPPTKVDVTRQAVAPNAAAPHAFAEDNSVRLLDEGGNEVSVDDLFDYPSPDRPGILAMVRQRVYREFTHPGARTKTVQLLYPAGAMVSIFEAERVKAENRPSSAVAAPAGE